MTRSDDLYTLPEGLPVPVDDGACDHLPGLELPALALPSTAGGTVSLRDVEARKLVLDLDPRNGLPDRDHHAELRALGAEVFGVSTQETGYQREAATRPKKMSP